jgi:hypothetical protein
VNVAGPRGTKTSPTASVPFTVEVPVPPVVELTTIAGDQKKAAKWTIFAEPLTVRATSGDAPVTNLPVFFMITDTAGGGSHFSGGALSLEGIANLLGLSGVMSMV